MYALPDVGEAFRIRTMHRSLSRSESEMLPPWIARSKTPQHFSVERKLAEGELNSPKALELLD